MNNRDKPRKNLLMKVISLLACIYFINALIKPSYVISECNWRDEMYLGSIWDYGSDYWCLLEEVILAEHMAVSRETLVGQSRAAVPTCEASRVPTSFQNPQNVLVQDDFLASTAFWYRGYNRKSRRQWINEVYNLCSMKTKEIQYSINNIL